jgi:hypothetical protein
MPDTIETLTGATDPNEAPEGKAYKLRVRIVAMCHQIEQTCEAARALAERTSKLLLELAAIDKAR